MNVILMVILMKSIATCVIYFINFTRKFIWKKKFKYINSLLVFYTKIVYDVLCRNPTLAKCGGEAQHLEKLRIWSPQGLPNVQSSTARPKTPRIEEFLVSLERSWNVDIENGLALAIQTSYGQKKGRESNWQFDFRPLKVGNRPVPDVRSGSATWRWKDLDEGYNFGSDLVAIQLCSWELWQFKVPGVPSGQFRDNFGTPFRESREFVPFGCLLRG
jgi:hypothetical protein